MIDLLNVETFAKGHPFEAYDAMRRDRPIASHEGTDRLAPFKVLTRYEDVHAVSHDTARFSSASGFRLPTAMKLSLGPGVLAALGRIMLNMDAPEHTSFRRILMPAFSPQRLRALESEVELIVRRLLDGFEDRDSAEFVEEIAAVTPIHILCHLLGVPEEDRGKVFDWTNRLVGADDPEYGADVEAVNAAFEQVFEYGRWLIARKRQAPADDLMSVVANAEAHGIDLDQPARDGFCATFIAAGNETTRNALTGSILALTAFPDQKARLIADPDLGPNAVEELLRFVSPVIQMMRTAREDTVVGGEPVAAGEKLVMLYGAANRDPDIFPDPHRLDLTRSNAKRHLAFGTGVHHCIGGRLAALELKVLLRELLTRYPNIRPAGDPDYLRSNFVSGIKRLPVRLT